MCVYVKKSSVVYSQQKNAQKIGGPGSRTGAVPIGSPSSPLEALAAESL
jgi:hypothetical protein